MLFSKLTLKLKAKTWNKNSHGLYDYETRDYTAQSIDISNSSALSRLNTKLTCSPLAENKRRETMYSANPNEAIATITECSEGIAISCTSTEEEGPNQFWQAVDRGSDKGYMLKVDDVIRFGRTMAKVRQIKTPDEQNTALSYQNSVFKSIAMHNEDRRLSRVSSTCKESAQAGTTCKICLGEMSEDEDPLISPCNCSGSMKYVHYKCLQNWMQSKLNMQKNKNIININWQRLQCELCKTGLELIIKHEGRELLLVPCSEEMMSSYALIEFFSKDSSSTGVYLIGLNTNSKEKEKTERFKIGRGQDCDFNTRDISVSRVHSYLFSINGKLYLKDNASRFGTLVLMREPVLLSNSTTESPLIQCGRTCFKFTLHKPWTSFLPCFSSLYSSQNKVDEFQSCQPMARFPKMLKGMDDELDDEELDVIKNQERDRRTMI